MRATIMAGGSPIGSRTGGGTSIPLILLLLLLATALPIALFIDDASGPTIRLKTIGATNSRRFSERVTKEMTVKQQLFR